MELLQRLLYTALSAASIIYFIVKASLSHWKRRGILHEKPRFLVGNLGGVGGKRHISAVLEQLYEKYKGQAPFIGCYAYLKPMVLILDLDLVRNVLITHCEHFKERGVFGNAPHDPLSANLLQQDGADWQRLNTVVCPAFAQDNISQMLPTLEKVASTMHRSLTQVSEDAAVPVNNLVDCYNIDVISTLAFGISGETLLNSDTEFRRMARSYLKDFNMFRLYFLMYFPNVARLLRYKNYEQAATDYFLKLVRQKLFEQEWSRLDKRNSFFHMFAELKRDRDPKRRLSDEEIAAQAFSFILMGLETCNSAMTFCLYELALQPDLQRRVQEEICNVLKRNENGMDSKNLNDMNLLRQCLNETLRKHTPYSFLLRNTNEDYEVPNSIFMLRPDNHLVIPIAAIHHDPLLYPEPNKFDPERFSKENIKRRHPMAFLPYGAGPRYCLAQQFAEKQMLVGLGTLLRDYSFSPCRETPIPLVYDNKRLVLTPKDKLKLNVQRR
ncbi:probable cytochrome P450 6u1 [Bactrocera neohumeralis]|uniref:probable cytochrome P450 6u1 n=1 Tax=Bactrocera tryoni TaxID=59916 RepID=UPI001A95BAD1|nr:probable cytochrome P450 6u1 [Bactrocera tryoni]XP_050322951.1 probable cytochrome P450 6u1 [Bactrocera neohumeralis]XP_050322952.1 probable cytochrome P450 6u1 [Bactrocera neohumeralis]